MKCRNCGKENPQGARYCGYCQQKLEKEKSTYSFKKYGVLIAVCAVLCSAICILLIKDELPIKEAEYVATSHAHIWTAANCIAPKTCEICGITTGRAKSEHEWTVATCLTPRTCKICGITSGSTVLHSWRAATADAPKTCRVCGKTRGYALSDPRYVPVENEKVPVTVESVIRKRLPIATYAMTDAEKVYSYSDVALTEQTKQYYFNSRTDEIVILDISEDGRALYVRYPSTITSTGYRDCWFAADDILGSLETAVSTYTADTKIKTYRRNDNDAALIYYDMIHKGTEVSSLGKHIWDKLIIYPLSDPENILDITVTERMALTSTFDQVNRLSVDGYKTFAQYLEYDYSHLHPDRILTKEWEDGGIKICFLNKRELLIKLKDSHMFNYPLTYNAVPLTKVNLFAGQDDHTGIEIMFSVGNVLQHNEYLTDIVGKRNQSQSFSSVQFDHSDGYITM